MKEMNWHDMIWGDRGEHKILGMTKRDADELELLLKTTRTKYQRSIRYRDGRTQVQAEEAYRK